MTITNYKAAEHFGKQLKELKIQELYKIDLLGLCKQLEEMLESIESMPAKWKTVQQTYSDDADLPEFLAKHQKAMEVIRDAVLMVKKKADNTKMLLKKIVAHYGKQPIFYQPDNPKGNEAEILRDIKSLVPKGRMKEELLNTPIFAYVLYLLGNDWEEAMKRNEQLKREQLKKSSPPTSPRGGQKPFEKTIDIKEKIGLELKHFDRSSLRKSGRDIAAGGA